MSRSQLHLTEAMRERLARLDQIAKQLDQLGVREDCNNDTFVLEEESDYEQNQQDQDSMNIHTPRAFSFKKAGLLRAKSLSKKAGTDVKNGKSAETSVADLTVENVETLVEIKPRKRDSQIDANREHRHCLDHSAFDDLPPVEVYDPSWNTSPLRCEAGQLRQKVRNTDQQVQRQGTRGAESMGSGGTVENAGNPGGAGARGGSGAGETGIAGATGSRGPVLPNAFFARSSTDLESNEDNDIHRSDHDPLNSENQEPNTAESLPTSSQKSVHSFGRFGADAISFLGLRKKDATGLSGEILQTTEDARTTIKCLTDALQQLGAIDTLSLKPTELRARVRFKPDPGSQNEVTITVVFSLMEFEVNKTKVFARRSSKDKLRVSPDTFNAFCAKLVKIMQPAKPAK